MFRLMESSSGQFVNHITGTSSKSAHLVLDVPVIWFTNWPDDDFMKWAGWLSRYSDLATGLDDPGIESR
jgi:hypothetical protein